MKWSRTAQLLDAGAQYRHCPPIEMFQQEFAGLAPEGIEPFDATWDTAGIERGPYRLIGYALYKGTSTGPAVLNLHTATRIYLPLVVKDR